MDISFPRMEAAAAHAAMEAGDYRQDRANGRRMAVSLMRTQVRQLYKIRLTARI